VVYLLVINGVAVVTGGVTVVVGGVLTSDQWCGGSRGRLWDHHHH
jgi:hypothetical protein